jgi:hypothetical protein
VGELTTTVDACTKAFPHDSAPSGDDFVATDPEEQLMSQQIAPLGSYKEASLHDFTTAEHVVVTVDVPDQVSEEPEYVVYSTSDLNAMFDNWQQELDAKIASITSQVELDPISSDEDEDSLESDVEEEQEDESFEGSVCSEECEESFESESVQDPANSSKSTHNIEVGTSEERQCKEPFKEPADASFRASIEDVKEQDETSQKRASEEQQQAISETIEPISKKCEEIKAPVIVDPYSERITKLSCSILAFETTWADRNATAFFIPRAFINTAGALHTEYRNIPCEFDVFTLKRLSHVLNKWHALFKVSDAYINLSSDFPNNIAYEFQAGAEEIRRTSVAMDDYHAKAQKTFGTLRYKYWRDMAAGKRDRKNALMAAVKVGLGYLVQHYMEYFRALQEFQTLVPSEEVEYLISVSLKDYYGRIKHVHKTYGIDFAEFPDEVSSTTTLFVCLHCTNSAYLDRLLRRSLDCYNTTTLPHRHFTPSPLCPITRLPPSNS